MSLSVKEILSLGKKRLADSGVADADIDSKALYCYMTNISNAKLILEYQNILQDMLCDEYFSLIDRRASGIPLQYITGTQEFMGFEFDVDENVLIPRQDTETLVEDAISVINDRCIRGDDVTVPKGKQWDVLDLCCGSGAIGISIAKLCEGTKVTCSDVSEGAIFVAKRNGAKNGVEKKVTFTCGDLFEPFKGFMKSKKFDLIISNPPYIESDVIPTLQREVKDHEPMSALDGGADGLDFYKLIISQSPEMLKKGGVLMFEIGHNQGQAVCNLLEETGCFEQIRCEKDLVGHDRIVFATLVDLKAKKKREKKEEKAAKKAGKAETAEK